MSIDNYYFDVFDIQNSSITINTDYICETPMYISGPSGSTRAYISVDGITLNNIDAVVIGYSGWYIFCNAGSTICVTNSYGIDESKALFIPLKKID